MKIVFVHRYKWSKAKLRKQLRRAAKDGIVTLIDQPYNGLVYKVPSYFKLKP